MLSCWLTGIWKISRHTGAYVQVFNHSHVRIVNVYPTKWNSQRKVMYTDVKTGNP